MLHRKGGGWHNLPGRSAASRSLAPGFFVTAADHRAALAAYPRCLGREVRATSSARARTRTGSLRSFVLTSFLDLNV